MKAAKIVLILIGVSALINFVRQGADFPLPQAFPLCDGRLPSPSYLLGGLCLIVLLCWGFSRLRGGSASKDTPSQESSEYEQEDADGDLAEEYEGGDEGDDEDEEDEDDQEE